MGKILSLLILFPILITFQSCIGTDGILGKKSIYEDSGFIVEDAGFIISDDDDDLYTVEDRQKLEHAKLLNTLEDSVSEGVAATQRLPETSEEILEYQTKKNETLMLVAFSIYGDYRKWRELYSLNKDVLGDSYDLSHRPILKYKKPLRPYTPPMGNPYLIKSGDSLSLISKKVYGDWREWPAIHKNNPKQIRDPNLIFAGFTLYYLPLNKIALQLY